MLLGQFLYFTYWEVKIFVLTSSIIPGIHINYKPWSIYFPMTFESLPMLLPFLIKNIQLWKTLLISVFITFIVVIITGFVESRSIHFAIKDSIISRKELGLTNGELSLIISYIIVISSLLLIDKLIGKRKLNIDQ